MEEERMDSWFKEFGKFKTVLRRSARRAGILFHHSNMMKPSVIRLDMPSFTVNLGECEPAAQIGGDTYHETTWLIKGILFYPLWTKRVRFNENESLRDSMSWFDRWTTLSIVDTEISYILMSDGTKDTITQSATISKVRNGYFTVAGWYRGQLGFLHDQLVKELKENL